MDLISLEEAKAHLQMDHDESDAEIQRMIAEASAAVLNYLDGAPIGQPVRDEQGVVVRDTDDEVVYLRDSDDNLIVRFEVQAATKLLVGYLFRLRDEDERREFEMGYLPRPVTALLYPLRRPAVA